MILMIFKFYTGLLSHILQIKLSMYKPEYCLTRSSQNIPRPTLSSPNSRNVQNKFSCVDKLDLKKFNEYLQDKINRKAYKNRMKDSKRGQAQTDNANYVSRQFQRLKINANLTTQKSSQLLGYQASRPPSAQRSKSPHCRAENDYLSGKVNWKRHESIEKLLEKENKFMENSVRKQQMHEESSSSTEIMQEKYQQLQLKYNKLVQQTIFSNKQFEENKKELQMLKQKSYQDHQLLMQLKSELMGIQLGESKPVTRQKESKNVQTINSQPNIESDVSISTSEQAQKLWNPKQSSKNLKNSNVYSKGNRTTQSWMNKSNLTNNNQFHQPSSRYEQPAYKSRNIENEQDRKSNRYYSADKMSSSTRRNSKNKKISDVVQYTQIESKTTIKFGESLSCSKIKMPQKYAYVQQKYEPQRIVTPTTLQKKVLNSNQYSKYRFQPTVRLN